MMKYFSIFLILFQAFVLEAREDKSSKNIVTSTTKLEFANFPRAFNPSIAKTDLGLVLTFRYCLAPAHHWISYVGIVLLDDSLKPITEPELLNTRDGGSITPSQAEDARVFVYNGSLYLIYNDNIDYERPTPGQRRDMFIAQLSYSKGHFKLSNPVKLFHETEYAKHNWQKNWVPFEWNNNLLLSYSLIPHEVLFPDLSTGLCQPIYNTFHPIDWGWGKWRGGTQASLVDGEYLAFFHSSIVMKSAASNGISMHHYYMGAYTFSSNPPFEITRTSQSPIIADGFYTISPCDKRVIFPGGFTVNGSNIYVSYGKDDSEIWVAVMDKSKLKKSLVPVRRL